MAATGTLAPYINFTVFDNNGAIVPGAQIFTYTAGTSDKLATYTTSALTVANTNPVVADAAGRAVMFLAAASYKFIVAPANDTDPPTNPYYTRDNIGAVPFVNVDLDIQGTAGEALTATNAVYLSDGTGGLTAGRWYKADADLTYASVTAQAIGFVPTDIASAASGSIRLAGRLTGLSGLTSGSVYYVSATAGAITNSAPTNARAVAVADSTTSIVISSGTTPSVASATLAGIVSLTTQTLGAGTKSVDKLTYKPGAVTTFDANASGRILGPFITSQATATTTETSTIATPPTIKANTLNANGDVLRATYVGITSANAQQRNWKVKLGGTQITDFQFTSNAALGAWKLVVEIVRTGASSQIITNQLFYSEVVAAGATWQVVTDVQTGAKDLTTDLTLDVTIQNAVAGTITFKAAFFEVIGL